MSVTVTTTRDPIQQVYRYTEKFQSTKFKVMYLPAQLQRFCRRQIALISH